MLDCLDQSSASTVATAEHSGQPRDTSRISFVWICSTAAPEATLRRYLQAIEVLPNDSELIIINNGLGTATSTALAAQLSGSGVAATIVSLHRACGESAALSTSLQQITGQYVILLPPYPQSDPNDILRLIAELSKGLDYVASCRRPRVDGWAGERRSRLYNWLARRISNVDLSDINSGLRAMRRQVLDQVPLYGDLHLFLPILAARQGFRVGEVPVRHLEERVGAIDEGKGVYLRRLLDLLTLFFLLRFTHKPFRLFGGIGAGLTSSGALVTFVLAVQRLLGEPLADRPMLIFGTMLIVLGIQLFSLGLLGELIIYVNADRVTDYQIETVYRSSHGEGARYGR